MDHVDMALEEGRGVEEAMDGVEGDVRDDCVDRDFHEQLVPPVPVVRVHQTEFAAYYGPQPFVQRRAHEEGDEKHVERCQQGQVQLVPTRQVTTGLDLAPCK